MPLSFNDILLRRKISAHHINDHFAQCLPLLLGEVDEYITVGVLEELEGDRQVVVLQHTLVIVHQGQLRAEAEIKNDEFIQFFSQILNNYQIDILFFSLNRQILPKCM